MSYAMRWLAPLAVALLLMAMAPLFAAAQEEGIGSAETTVDGAVVASEGEGVGEGIGGDTASIAEVEVKVEEEMVAEEVAPPVVEPPKDAGRIHDTDAGIGPGHPLYALDSLGEQLQMAFTFNKKKRAQRALKIAEEKMAELDGLKERVEFSDGGVKAATLKKAYKRYESRMQVVEASVAQVGATEKDLPALVEKVAQKQAEHKAAFEEHKAAMPEEVRAHVEEQLQRAVERQREVVERVENPVAKARILENIAKHQDAYVERRKLWLDTQTYVHRAEAEARLGEEASPERAAELKVRVEEKFQALERQREEQFEMMRRDIEEEKARREEEHAAEAQKLEDAGFESREEAIEAYEALDGDGREKMRAFFGVGKEEADRVLVEIKELRAEHGDEWKGRLMERQREEMDRERQRMEEELKRREREFGEEGVRERGDIERMRAEFERGGFEGGAPPEGFEGGVPPEGFEGGVPPEGFEGGVPPEGFNGMSPEGFEGGPPEGFRGAPPERDRRPVERRPIERRPVERRPSSSVESFKVTPEPGFVPYDEGARREAEREGIDKRERIYRNAPELPEGHVLSPLPPEGGFVPGPAGEVNKEIVPKEKYVPMSVEGDDRGRAEPTNIRKMVPPVIEMRGRSRERVEVREEVRGGFEGVREGGGFEGSVPPPSARDVVKPAEVREVAPPTGGGFVGNEPKESSTFVPKEPTVEMKEPPKEPPPDVVSSIMGALQRWFAVPEIGTRLGASR